MNLKDAQPYLTLAGGAIAVAVGYLGQTRGYVVLGAIVVVVGFLVILAGLRQMWKLRVALAKAANRLTAGSRRAWRRRRGSR
jgi:hypothetical protein